MEFAQNANKSKASTHDANTPKAFTQNNNLKKKILRSSLVALAKTKRRGYKKTKKQNKKSYKKAKNAISPFNNASRKESIGATIHIGREIGCLRFAGFSFYLKNKIVFF